MYSVNLTLLVFNTCISRHLRQTINAFKKDNVRRRHWRPPPTAPSTAGLKWRSLKITLLTMQHYTITQWLQHLLPTRCNTTANCNTLLYYKTLTAPAAKHNTCNTAARTPTASHRPHCNTPLPLQHFVASPTAAPTLQVTTWLSYNHRSPHCFYQTTPVRAGLSFGRPIYISAAANVIHLTTVLNTYIFTFSGAQHCIIFFTLTIRWYTLTHTHTHTLSYQHVLLSWEPCS